MDESPIERLIASMFSSRKTPISRLSECNNVPVRGYRGIVMRGTGQDQHHQLECGSEPKGRMLKVCRDRRERSTSFAHAEGSHLVTSIRCAIGSRTNRSREGTEHHEPPSSLMDPVLPWLFPRRAGRCCMATATKTRLKTRKTQVRLPLPSDHLREADSSQTSPPLTQVSREQEPLENAVRRQEAPEAWQTRRSEAPDAGRGTECSEHDTFTRGRSMS